MRIETRTLIPFPVWVGFSSPSQHSLAELPGTLKALFLLAHFFFPEAAEGRLSHARKLLLHEVYCIALGVSDLASFMLPQRIWFRRSDSSMQRLNDPLAERHAKSILEIAKTPECVGY
jgi:hypothetical protein